MEEIKVYWNNKFIKKKDFWGKSESLAAQETLKFLSKINLNKGALLDVGCGYGRDSIFFQNKGYDVVGIDFSEEAIKLGNEMYPGVKLEQNDMEMLDYKMASFDIIFGNFFLHLFVNLEKRRSLAKICYDLLKPRGYFFHSVASIDDSDYAKGQKISENLVINDRGVKKYYYSKDILKKEFDFFNILEINELIEKHTHDSPHEHRSFLIICQK